MSKEDAKKFLEAARDYDFTTEELREAAKEVDLSDGAEDGLDCKSIGFTAVCTV